MPTVSWTLLWCICGTSIKKISHWYAPGQSLMETVLQVKFPFTRSVKLTSKVSRHDSPQHPGVNTISILDWTPPVSWAELPPDWFTELSLQHSPSSVSNPHTLQDPSDRPVANSYEAYNQVYQHGPTSNTDFQYWLRLCHFDQNTWERQPLEKEFIWLHVSEVFQSTPGTSRCHMEKIRKHGEQDWN